MASSIVKSAAQQLGNLVMEETKYLYKISDKIEILQTELKWMECFLRDADTQQHQEEVIREWVSQVQDLAYDAEDIIQRYLYEVTHHRQDGIRNSLEWFLCILCTCDTFTLHDLGSEIQKMTIQISELTSRLQRYGIQIIKPSRSLEYNAMSREERRTYPHIEEDVVGLEEDIELVVNQILNTNVNVVGISGIGGLGKTTLARKVFKNEEIQNQYTCVWVYISQEFEKTRIFQEILNGLDKGGSGNANVVDLPQEIYELLKNKKCFVVLDDIWTVAAWKRLEPAFQSIKSSLSKILLTTRKQDLLQHVDPFGYPHCLKPLSPDDSWELLQCKAFSRHENFGGESSTLGQNKPQDDKKVELEKLGREMLSHCDGLPLAIVALGGILSTKKIVTEWKKVQQSIASYLMSGEQGHESGRIAEVLELSYHDLPFYLKPCFLYLGSFPEDYEIFAHRLYHLWEAEGLLSVKGKTKKQGETSYDVGERYLNELIQRSMVQLGESSTNGRIRTCKLHDIMRDLCLKKGEEINFLDIVEFTVLGDMPLELPLASCSGIENKKLRRRVVHWKVPEDDFEESGVAFCEHGEKKKRGTCVRSVMVFPLERKSISVSKETWKPFPLLRVLDLEGARFEYGRRNLEGVEDLIHLRYLNLRNTYIDSLLPRFYDLKCVKTLDLRSHSEVFMIPACGLQMMERLRHLYLPELFNLRESYKLRLPVVGGQMETLINFDPSKCEIGDLLGMINLRVFDIKPSYWFGEKDKLAGVLEAPVMKKSGQLINTMQLAISSHIFIEEPTILSSLAGRPRFFDLEVSGSHENDVVSSIIGFMDSLERLSLYGIGISEADILALGKLPHLKYLELNSVTLLVNKITFSVGSFPRLNFLELRYLRKLEDLEVMEGALPNLQRLEIFDCDKLKMLPQGLSSALHSECSHPCIGGLVRVMACEQSLSLKTRIIEHYNRNVREREAISTPLVEEREV